MTSCTLLIKGNLGIRANMRDEYHTGASMFGGAKVQELTIPTYMTQAASYVTY